MPPLPALPFPDPPSDPPRDQPRASARSRGPAVQLGLFTGEPVRAEWMSADAGGWWCVRCLRALPAGPKPKRRCGCGRR